MSRRRLATSVIALLIMAATLLVVFIDDIATARLRATLEQTLAGSNTSAEFDTLSLSVFSASPGARLGHVQLRHGDATDSNTTRLQGKLNTVSITTSWGSLLTGSVSLDRLDVDGVQLALTLPALATAADAAGDASAPVDSSAAVLEQPPHLSENLNENLDALHAQLTTGLQQVQAWLGDTSITNIQLRIDREASTTALLDATGAFSVHTGVDATQATLALSGIAQPDKLQWPALADDGRFEIAIDTQIDTDSSVSGVVQFASAEKTLGAEFDTQLAEDWQRSETRADIAANDERGTALTLTMQQTGYELTLHVAESPRHRSDLTLTAALDTQSSPLAIHGNIVSTALRPEEINEVLQPWLPVFPTDPAPAGAARNDQPPVAFRPPAGVDIQFELDIAQFEFRQLQASQVSGQLLSSPTALSLDIGSDQLAGGTVRMSLEQTQTESDFRGNVYLGVQNARIEPLLSSMSAQPLLSGDLSGEWEFGFRGTSLEAMSGSLFGEGYLLIENGKIDSMAVELAGIDLQESLALMFKKDFHQYAIECGYTDVSASQGRITIEHFLLDAGDTWFQAEGYADLPANRIDVTLKPRPKDASYLSLTSSLHIRGPLSSPKVRPGKKLYGKLAVGAALAAFVSPVGLVLPMIRLGDGKERQPCTEMQIE